MSKIVVDTNVLVALLDSKDVHHQKAVRLAQRLENEKRQILLMDCILVELYSVIARRSRERGYDFSLIFPQIMEIEEMYDIIMAYDYRTRLHTKALNLILLSGGALNYHDALISLVMKRKRIKQIATFDKDFATIDWVSISPVNLFFQCPGTFESHNSSGFHGHVIPCLGIPPPASIFFFHTEFPKFADEDILSVFKGLLCDLQKGFTTSADRGLAKSILL